MMKIYATEDREYWTKRKLTCSACGYISRHYEVNWDSQNAPEVLVDLTPAEESR